MKIYELYDAIFDPSKQVQLEKAKVNQFGQGVEPSGWVSISKEDNLTSFIGGCLPSSTQIICTNKIKISERTSHDGDIVEVYGRKYLLTEIKDI